MLLLKSLSSLADCLFCSLFDLFNCRLILISLSFVFVLLSLNLQNWFWWAHLRRNRVERSQSLDGSDSSSLFMPYCLIPISIFSFWWRDPAAFYVIKQGKLQLFCSSFFFSWHCQLFCLLNINSVLWIALW